MRTGAAEVIEEKEEGSPSDIISVAEACEFLGVHRNTLYKLIQAREIPAFRMMTGGRWKFRRSELEQWLEDKQTRARL
jgi:excisionase family DNA binding protein